MSSSMPSFVSSNVDLAPYNTLKFSYRAEYFCLIESLQQLRQVLVWANEANLPWRVLGGGSNLVIREDLLGVTLVIRLAGQKIIQATDDIVLVEVAAGEVWHDFVAWTVQNDWWGLENLALIPGTVGAAPVQNIGAYGVEVKDRISAIQVLDTHTMAVVCLSGEDCAFGYRESAFKRHWAGRYIILGVRFSLSKQPQPILNYGGLGQSLSSSSSQQEIFDTVCRVRGSKLPDPTELANVGSYFKNPIVDALCYQDLKVRYPDLVAFPHGTHWKLAAGWLNERLGWKGKRLGNVGVYEKQALVLVNFADRRADGLLNLQEEIQQSVWSEFGVKLEREPILWPQDESCH